MLHSQSLNQYYMKLSRASHIKRCFGTVAEGEPGGEAGPLHSPAKLLVVAFSASQGEPEWMGLLSRLAALGKVSKQAPLEGPLADVLGGDMTASSSSMAMLWSGCLRCSYD